MDVDLVVQAMCKFQSMLCVEGVCKAVPNSTVIVPADFALNGGLYSISCTRYELHMLL